MMHSGVWDPSGDPCEMVGGAKHKWLVVNRDRLFGEMDSDGLFEVCYRYRIDLRTVLQFIYDETAPVFAYDDPRRLRRKPPIHLRL